MLRSIIIALFLTGFAYLGQSQKVVTLVSGGTSSFYQGTSPLADAYADAVDGDTIILPGGSFAAVGIDKSITVLGDGFFPDSTTVNGSTVITGTLTIYDDADNLHLEGIRFTGQIYVEYNHRVDSILIKRCELESGMNIAGNRTDPCIGINIIQSALGGNMFLTNSNYTVVSNCVSQYSISNFYYATIRNNVFVNPGHYHGYPYYTNYILYSGNNSQIVNNVFNPNTASGVKDDVTYSHFERNVWRITPTYESTNTDTLNYEGVTDTVLVNNTGGTSLAYSADYNLRAPGTYVGDDATQCGIFGGLYPWKDGAVPFHPHYIMEMIDKYSTSGTLDVEIKVQAQDE